MDKIRQMLEDLEKELRQNKQYSAADKLLPIIEEAEKDGWIPCSERPPEDDRNVLIYFREKDDAYKDRDGVSVSCYKEAFFGTTPLNFKEWREPFAYFHRNYDVIAWRELPEPYKGE